VFQKSISFNCDIWHIAWYWRQDVGHSTQLNLTGNYGR